MGDKDAKLRQSILNALAQSDGPLLTPDVLKLLDCGEQFTKTNINCALYHMKSAGLIERIESQPPAWRLPGRGGAEPRAVPQATSNTDTSKGPSLFSSEPETHEKKVKLESCASDDDVDKFPLTPPVQKSHGFPDTPQTGSPIPANSGSKSSLFNPPSKSSLFNPPSTPLSQSQVPVPSAANHSQAANLGSSSLARARVDQDDANFLGTQRNIESTQPSASQFASRNAAPSPFFPAAYSVANANSFSSPSPADNPSTFRSVSPNSFNPVASTPRPPQPNPVFSATVSTPRPPQPNPVFSAAVVKADPWAATAAPAVKPNFSCVRPPGASSNKPPNGHAGGFPPGQPRTLNKFDVEFGEALPDFSEGHTSNFSAHKQPGNGFQQQFGNPKLPTFNIASKANQAPPTPNGPTNQFSSQPTSFPKRKMPGIESPGNPMQFSQGDIQKRAFQKRGGQDLNEDEMPEGGVPGKSKWFAISGKKRVTVEYWKGQPLVSIREYYLDNGIMKPGKKGVSLTIEQWVALKGHIGSVDMAIKELSGL